MLDAHWVFFKQFIVSFKAIPEEIILNSDATDGSKYGCKENTFYYGYDRHYCYPPLYIFCNN